MKTKNGLSDAIARFGKAAKDKLKNTAIAGEPEEQLRNPLEKLVQDLAALAGLPSDAIVTVGETAMTDLKVRPDFAVTRQKALIGFIEVKAPHKGADPRRFSDKHDKTQWERLKSLPNLLYTDGMAFSVWRNGELEGQIVRLDGDILSAGSSLSGPPTLQALFSDFFSWNPTPPGSAQQLALTAARLCRLLRDEVTEQLGIGSPALTGLAEDWRAYLFPTASDAEFADGYAQAVTFGMLMARARGIVLTGGLHRVAHDLSQTNSLIGTAFKLLTDEADNQDTLKVSLGTLTRVLDEVDWAKISKGDPDAWLYFYEEFLSAYDNDLRKKTGSYYTPPEIVNAMVRLVDEALRDPRRFGVPGGLAAKEVTLADPAVGTGTYLLGILRRIADMKAEDEGEGAVPDAIRDTLPRLIGFEMQFGPYVVAQLRLLAEAADLMGIKNPAKAKIPLRLYVTNTLGNPHEEVEHIPRILAPLAESRKEANKIKRAEPITVVIGNPPYKEKAKGLGGWVEEGSQNANEPAPLRAWFPPTDWGLGPHVKHLRNLYVYFWRWATWKVFGEASTIPASKRQGIVSFITVAGFLNGPGFEKMRADLRRDTNEIWVIDCSPEGHQPDVPTRVFQGVQQPVCIVMVMRLPKCDPEIPARVRFRALPVGRREDKFDVMGTLTLDSAGWIDCPSDWRAPFLPEAAGSWSTFVPLDDLFVYNGSGAMPGRTWVIAPDKESLERRWKRLISEKNPAEKDLLFHPHEGGDRTVSKVLREHLPGAEHRDISVGKDKGDVIPPIHYAFRSFDRQWIIPDNRLLNRPNPTLWSIYSNGQIFLTAPQDRTPSNGPSLSFTSLIPDLHHYAGRGGRTFPLWADHAATMPNLRPALLTSLASAYKRPVSGEDVFAYIAAVASHPAYTAKFQGELVQPGLRIPITADAALFDEAVELGRRVVWLHSFGERFIAPDPDPAKSRPPGPPRLPKSKAPTIPKDGTIPADADSIDYDTAKNRLLIGTGFIDHVPPRVWEYEVSGKHVLTQWFSYRRKNRERPIIGDRRPPSPLGDIQPSGWLAEYTTELINLLHVLGGVVDLEPKQASLLDRICTGPTLSDAQLRAAGAFVIPEGMSVKASKTNKAVQPGLFD